MSLIALDDAEYNFQDGRIIWLLIIVIMQFFYCAKALLLKKGFEPKKHSGTVYKFGIEYVVNNDFNEDIASIFSDLFELREKSDYAIFFESTEELAENSIINAKLFIEEAKNFF
jgi:uncharacterized protein (UPF0332 family)